MAGDDITPRGAGEREGALPNMSITPRVGINHHYLGAEQHVTVMADFFSIADQHVLPCSPSSPQAVWCTSVVRRGGAGRPDGAAL